MYALRNLSDLWSDRRIALQSCALIAHQKGVSMAELMAELREHPIMITLQDAISGNGFLAGVTLSGRALMRKEDDGKWWMYGVRPAAIAESGNSPEDTFLRFRTRYKETLLDIA